MSHGEEVKDGESLIKSFEMSLMFPSVFLSSFQRPGNSVQIGNAWDKYGIIASGSGKE